MLNSYVVLPPPLAKPPKFTPLPSSTFFFALSVPLVGVSFAGVYLKNPLHEDRINRASNVRNIDRKFLSFRMS